MSLLKTLFEGVEGLTLSEGFELKFKTVYEAAVSEKADQIVTEKVKALDEAFDKKLTEAKDAYVDFAAGKLQEAVDAALVEWATTNAIALDSLVKSQIAESFLGGLKTLFLESQVELPEANAGELVESLRKEIETLKESAVTLQASADEKAKLVESFQKSSIISELTEGLADTQKDRVQRLASDFTLTNESEFRSKVSIIVEAISGKEEKKPEDKKDEKQEDKKDGKPEEMKEGQVVQTQVTESVIADPVIAAVMASYKKAPK